MEKDLEKSLKRFLKRKVKITMGLVVSFLITGMVSFAEGNTKGADKKARVKEEYIIDKELLRNILREISVGNIYIVENGETVKKTQEIGNGKIGINDGTVSGYYKAQNISEGIGINNNELTTRGEYNHAYGQYISNGLGINNGTINITSSYDKNNYGQWIENSSLGINNKEMSGEYTQEIIYNSLGINNGTISGTYAGQSVIYNAIGINNGTIKAKYSVQSLADSSLGINNGIVSSIVTDGYDAGQRIGNGGVAINNGVISATNGQSTDNGGGTGINNGIIIANNAYVSSRGGETFHKNGIALKRENGKLVLNGDIGQAGNNENLTEKSGDFKNNFTDQTTQKEKNIFINNLEGENNKLNLISNSYDGVHITTAVSKESSFTENETVITTENNFSSLNKSTIIGYFEKNGTLIDMNGATNVTLTDSVISAIAGNSDTGFNGNALTDVNAIKFAEGSKVTLNNSTVNGKMKFSAGDNTLNLNGKYNGINSSTYKDGTQHGTYVSDVEFGTGNDNIEIKFGEVGQETYNSSYDKKGLVTIGNVNFGDGNDTLSFSFDEMRKGNFVLAGNIDFGTGNDDKIVFKSSLTDDNGESLVLMNNLLFNKITAGTLETLQLADGGNTIRFEQNIGQDKLSLNFNGKILGGKGDDKFIVSADKLKNNLTSLNGGADENKNPYNDNDILELTTAVDNNTSDVILFKNVENVETLKLADVDGNKLDINNISTSNPDTLRFKNYVGGDKDDSFTVSVENFEKLSSIDGGGNGTAGDTLTIEKQFSNSESLNKIKNMENLVFNSSDGGHVKISKIDLEKINELDPNNKDRKLNSITVNGSAEITSSTDRIGLINITQNNVGSGKIILTNAINETEKNTDLSFIDKLKGMDYLTLANAKNNVDLDLLIRKNSGIKNITGNKGQDIFKISVENLESGKIQIQETSSNDDVLELTTKLDNTNNTSLFNGILGSIEKLTLSKTENNVLIDNLVEYNNGFNASFSEVTGINGGEKGNTFTINGTDANKKDKALGMKIEGGASSNDTLKVNTQISAEQLSNKKGIENLELGLNSASPIDYNIDFTKLNDFKNITSGNGNDTFNNVSVGKVAGITGGAGTDTISLNEAVTDNSQINFGNLFDENKQGIEKLNLSDNGGNKLSFNDTLNIDNIGKVNFGAGENNTLTFIKNTNPTEYDLSNKTDIFNGNVAVDLNSNIISTGSSLSGDTIKLTDNFIGNGKVTFSNGEIRFNLADNISFADGTATKYNIDFGKLAESKDTVKTYSFLNIDKNQNLLTVKSLADLVTESKVSLDKDISNYTENYEILLKKYNTDTAVKTAFNNWTAGELVNASKDMIQDLGEIYIFDNNSREYKGIASSGLLIIDADMENQINNMTFNAVAGGKLAITNTSADGNGKIIFNGTTSFAYGIDGRYSRNAVHLDFNNTENNGITIGDIDLGQGKNSISIADVSKVNSIGKISSKENVNVILEKLDSSSEKFNNILANAEAGDNNSVEVTENNNTDIKLTTNYTKGKLAFTGTGNTVNLNKDNLAEYTGTVNLGENTFNINGSAMSGNIIGGKGNISVTDNGTWNVKQNTKVSQASLGNGNINIAENVKLDNTVFIENGKNNITGNGTVKDVTIKNGKISLGENTKVDVLNFANDGTGALVIGENFKSGNITAVAGTGNLDIDYKVTENSKFAEQVNSFENSIANLTQNGNTVNLTGVKLSEIKSGNGKDTFIMNNADDLNIKVTDNGTDNNDTLKLGFSVNNNSFDNISGIENLELKGQGNILDLTNLSFKNIVSGEGNDTFTISQDKLGNISITDSSASDSDTLKLSFKADGKENDISNVSKGIENLQLADGGNTINIDSLKEFKNITSGNGDDTFTVSVDNIGNMKIDGGENTADGKDTLKLSGALNNTISGKENILSGVSNVETLNLFADGKNTVNVDNLGFTTITGGNQGDSFIIGDSSKLGMTINGGTGADSLTLNTSVDTSKDLKNISGIENLTFNAKDNKLSFADADKNKFTSLSFGNNSTGNNVSLNELEQKDINFGTAAGNKVSVTDSQSTFKHKISGAETITLNGTAGTEWKFAEGSLITGNTTLDLGGGKLNFTDSQNRGNVGFDGTNLKINDAAFIGTGSKATVSKGTIKIGFDSSVKFADGVNTTFNLTGGEKIGFGQNLAFETYSFINVGNDLKVTVKQWSDYFTDKNDDRLVYAGRYDEALKKYNTEGNEALTEAFNIFGEKTVVDYIVNNANPKLLYYSDKGNYDVLVTEKGEDILIKTSDTEADKNTKLTFNNISSAGKIDIKVTEGNNEITFGNKDITDSAVNIAGETGIDFSQSATAVTLNVAGQKINEISKIAGNNKDNTINLSGKNISVNEIAFGTGNNTVKITDISNITKLGSITGTGNNIINIEKNLDDTNSSKFMELLKNKNITGVSEIILGENNKFTVAEDYNYSKNIFMTSGNQITVTGGILKADGLKFAGDNNLVTVNGGAVSGTLDFGAGTGNTFAVENTSGKFAYSVKDADVINLTGAKEWTFDGAKISGNTKVELNGNTAHLSSVSNGTNVTLNRDFAGVGVTFNNGTIKFDLDKNTDFSQGVETKLTLNDSGLTGTGVNLQAYAFLNVNADKTINVIDWKTLSGDGENTKETDRIVYNDTIKKFNEAGINGVLTVWEKDSIVSWIKAQGKVEGDHTMEGNTGDYNGLVSSGNITVDTNTGGKIEDLTIKDISSGKDLVIKNDSTEGNGKIDFTGSTAVSGVVKNESSQDVDITFGGNTNVGSIDSSKSEGKTNITIDNIKDEKDKFVSGDIIFNDKENKLDIKDSSDIGEIGTITGKVDITIENIGNGSDGFNKVLGGADKGLNGNKDNNSITVNQNADVNITNKYDGTLTFNGIENNITVGNSVGTLITGNGKDSVNLESNVGSLNTGSDDDIVNLDVSKFAENVIKVNADGGEGNDTFNIISSAGRLRTADVHTLDGKIISFETMNVKENVNFASTLEITGTNKINLEGKELTLSVDKTKVSGEKDNKPILTGHALYNKGINVDNSTGKIVVEVTAGALNSFISMGDTNKTTFTNSNNFTTNSINFEVEYDGNGMISLHTKEHFLGTDEAVKYAHLEKIHASIEGAGNDKMLLMQPSASTENKTKEEAIKAQLEFYGKIYHSTPYAYSNDVSKKSADLITESILNLNIMPEYKKWVFGGSIAGQEAESDSNFYGANHYQGIDIGKNEISAETNIYGAYAFGKYGIGENKSLGFAVAGTRSDTDISGNSKLEGDAVYISAFAEQEMNNLKLLAGISYQHSFYDSTRNVSNAYQSMKVEKDYEDDLFEVFAGAKYSYHLGNNFFFEPKAKLSVTHVMQEGINEGDNGLTIETDKKDFTSVETEAGFDIVKKVSLSKGTLNLRAGTSLVYSLEGHEEEYLTGRITGSNKDFEMISPEDDRTRVKFTVGTEYEAENGMFMNLHGNYTTSSHSKDYAVGLGVGYRF